MTKVEGLPDDYYRCILCNSLNKKQITEAEAREIFKQETGCDYDESIAVPVCDQCGKDGNSF